jgi:hypothetical protein
MDSRLEEARQFSDTFIRERRRARSISGVSMTSLSRLLLEHDRTSGSHPWRLGWSHADQQDQGDEKLLQ